MITCIIPVYNQEQYLADAIESALNQTKKCEVIVINDGSTDNSLEVAKRYPVKVIDQVNKGLASARNTGIMNAETEYILPLDADDLLLETCIEKMELAIQDHHSDVIAPSFKAFGVYNGEVILDTIPPLEIFRQVNPLPYFCAFKRSLLLEIGGYNPKMTWGWEDYDMHIDIFKRHKSLCMLSEILVLYRTKEQSMIVEANKHATELTEQMRKNHPSFYA